MSKIRNLKKSLLKSWFKTVSLEEIKQEEEIVKWLNPDLDGYQGLVSFYNLYKNKQKDFVKLKKNIPVKKTDMFPKEFNEIVLEIIDIQPENIKSKLSLILQGIIHNYYYGKKCNSIRDISRITSIPKSTIFNLIKEIKRSFVFRVT